MTKSLSLVLIFDWERLLSEFSFFDIGSNKYYYHENELALFEKWYKKVVKIQLKQIVESKEAVSIYFSGPFIELLSKYDAQIVKTIRSEIQNGRIELLGGTYHHSLSSLYDRSHFAREVAWHQKLIKKTFSFEVKSFFNTENIYSNDIADRINSLGFTKTFAGAVDWYLGKNKSQRIYTSRSDKEFKILLISDDQGQSLFQNNQIDNHFILFDVSQLIDLGGWNEIVRKVKDKVSVVSLDTQINSASDLKSYNVRQPISGSFSESELEQLNGHPLQESWLKQLYSLAASKEGKPEKWLKDWSSLCGISHLKRLNPDLHPDDHNTSYDTFRILINILSDLELKH